jgi:hypothetical protein
MGHLLPLFNLNISLKLVSANCSVRAIVGIGVCLSRLFQPRDTENTETQRRLTSLRAELFPLTCPRPEAYYSFIPSS